MVIASKAAWFDMAPASSHLRAAVTKPRVCFEHCKRSNFARQRNRNPGAGQVGEEDVWSTHLSGTPQRRRLRRQHWPPGVTCLRLRQGWRVPPAMAGPCRTVGQSKRPCGCSEDEAVDAGSGSLGGDTGCKCRPEQRSVPGVVAAGGQAQAHWVCCDPGAIGVVTHGDRAGAEPERLVRAQFPGAGDHRGVDAQRLHDRNRPPRGRCWRC